MKEVAQDMGTAVGTIYYYYKSKEDVINAVLARRGQEAMEAMRQAQVHIQNPYARVGAMVSALLTVAGGRDQSFVQLMFTYEVTAMTKQWLSRLRLVVSDAFHSFIGAKGSKAAIQVADPDVAIFYIIETVNAILNAMQFDMTAHEFDRHLTMAADMIAFLLGTSKGSIIIRL